LHNTIFPRRVDHIKREFACSANLDYAANVLRARAKITLHFKRRCIQPGRVAKVRNILDIPAL